jgi:uncharacterized protein YjiK
LGKVLNEISGITYSSEDSSILAISDSKKKVLAISLKKKKLKDFTDDVIPADSDIEDLAIQGSSVFMLSSRGTIFEVSKGATDTSGVKHYDIFLQGKNDFETLYYDPAANGLVMLCKSCASDKGTQSRSAYRFDLASRQFDTTVFYNIPTADVHKIVKDDNAKFDPSAAAIHPINKRLYILSSAGNLLVIADSRGKVIEGYHLNPDTNPQAEGIAFTPNGDMYISNEAKYGKPTLALYPYHNSKTKK